MSAFLPPEASEACRWISTPGMAKEIDWKKVADMESLCDNVVANLRKASLPNALHISERLNHGKDFGKLDPRLFFRMLSEKLLRSYSSGDACAGKMLAALSASSKPLRDRRVATEHASRRIVVAMWEAARDP